MKLDQAINEELDRLKQETPPDTWLDALCEKFPDADPNFLMEMVMIETDGDCVAEGEK
ncbi:MAG: hypothetical protein PHU14_16885 [Methylovulum sp.]|nr:hypothetical protein [Methylovulum sp.]